MTANPASGNLRIDPQNLATRLDDYWLTIRSWVEGNALELAISVVAATLLFLLLSWLKRVAARIARESEHRAELKSIIARTLARTSKFFRIMVAVELVNRYANAPA
jgi:hypothetical protein